MLAFSKTMADQRKEWLRGYDPDAHVDHSGASLDYTTFIDKELIHFSNADNVRSIPSMLDGLKPGQRKILFSCFKRGKSMTKNEIKVAQLAGYVSEHSAYHHGEASLAGTIVGMAQTFVGSNNVALLYPAGQFGTRLLGGKDAASPRYIFTKLPALTRLIFHPDDDALLEYQVIIPPTPPRAPTSTVPTPCARPPALTSLGPSPPPLTRPSPPLVPLVAPRRRTTASRSSPSTTCRSCRWSSSTAPTASAPAGRRRCPTTTRARSSPTCAA